MNIIKKKEKVKRLEKTFIEGRRRRRRRRRREEEEEEKYVKEEEETESVIISLCLIFLISWSR